MKKLFTAILLVALVATQAVAQSWHRPADRNLTNEQKFRQIIVLKEKITAADSTTETVISGDTVCYVYMGNLPSNALVTGGGIYSVTGLNSSGTDSISIGSITDIDYFAAKKACNGTGALTFTHGAGRVMSARTNAYIFYKKQLGSTAWPTSGDIKCWLEYIVMPN